jgi:hypothetical protein
VFKFHSILCLVAQESRLERKGSVLSKSYAKLCVNRTSPGRFPNKSGTVPGELVRVGIFSSAFNDCFGHILLTGCPIDLILFPLCL